MDVWRRTSPGTDPRRDRDHGRVASRQASNPSTRDTPSRAFRPARGVFFSGEVKWLDVGTSGFSAIAADTHYGVIGIAAAPFSRHHGVHATPSAPSSARRCVTAGGGVSTAVITSKRLKRRSTTSTR